VARNLFLAMCLTIQEEEREREREREGSLSARGTAGCEHGESINQGSIRRHFILDPRSRRPRLSHTRTSPPLAYPPPNPTRVHPPCTRRSLALSLSCSSPPRCRWFAPFRSRRLFFFAARYSGIYTGNIGAGLARSDGLESCSWPIPRGY